MSRLSLFRLSTILPFYYILAIVFIEQTRPLMCPCEKKTSVVDRNKQTINYYVHSAAPVLHQFDGH